SVIRFFLERDNMRLLHHLVIMQLFALGATNFMFAQPITQKLDANSFVDWERYVIRSTGNSSIISRERTASQKIQALESAKLAAKENLLKAIKALNFDTNSKVNDALRRKALSASHLESVVQRFTIVDTRSMSDMSVDVDIELPLTGDLFSMLLPKNTGNEPLRLNSKPLCPTCGQPWPEGKPVPEGIKLIIPSEGFTSNGGKPYTGLVIDARQLNVNPAILPKIINEDGKEIYGIGYVNRDVAVESGILAYEKELNEALKSERVGSEPLFIRGLRATGDLRANIIISNNDAVLIHAAAKSQNFLQDCRVVIVIG
ncbi:MAG: hypothetical protein ACE5HI_19130, partial [bacterium]